MSALISLLNTETDDEKKSAYDFAKRMLLLSFHICYLSLCLFLTPFPCDSL